MDPSDHNMTGMDEGVKVGDHESSNASNFSLGEDYGWLRPVIENSSEIVTIVDPDGTLRYASPSFGRMLGHDPGEVVGKMNVLEYVHPDDLPHVLEETEKALSKGSVVTNEAEYRFRHADGSWRWVESVGTYLLDDLHVGGVVVQTRDVTWRKEAEEALRRSEDKRLSVLESITDAFFVLDREWRFVYVNARAQDLFFNTREDLLGVRIWEDPTFFPHYRRAVEERKTVRFEALYPPSGSWYSVRAYPSASGLSVYLQDVTERKEAEERLREAEERYRTIIERVPAMTYIHHQTPGGFSGTTYVSPQVEHILGYTPEEYTAEPEFWKSIVHPDDRVRVLADDERTGETGEPFALDFRMLANDGRSVWLRESGTLVRTEDDGTQVWHGIMLDITELKRTEAELREAENLYRTLVEQIPAVTYVDRVTDGADEPLYTSPQIEEVLGYTPEEWLAGGIWSQCLHPEDRERVLAADKRFERERRERFGEEYRLLAKDGSVVWVREEAVLVRDEDGEPLYWQGVISDLTERKEAERALRESEERFRGTFEDAPIGVALVGLPSSSPEADRRYLRVNPALCEMLGYAEEELLSMTTSDVTHPMDTEKSRARMERLFEEGGSKYTMEKRYVRSDGRVVWAMLNVSLVRDADGNPSHFISQFQDVTQRKETEEALRRSEERYRNVLEEQTELVCRYLPDFTVTFANDAYCRYFGVEPVDVIGKSFVDRAATKDRAYNWEQLARLDRGTPSRTVERRVLTPGGGERWQQWTDTAIFDAEGRIVEYQSVGRDVTERKELEERLERQALHDPLTGLPNRRLFSERLGRALAGAGRRGSGGRGSGVAVLFMDLDGFKVVNDSLGHEAGDLLLTVVAQRLGRCLGPGDTLARFGGDEFVVLLESVGEPGEAMRVARRITDELRRPFALEGRELYVSASVGISFGAARAKGPEDLLRDADTAMYRAKEGGGGGFSVFDQAMHERVARRLDLENDLRRAIERGEFVLHYQPVVDLGDRRVWGTEALLRWEHPERGLLGPDEFVAVAEETGLIVPIGAWALGEACRRTKGWQDAHPREPRLGVIVNLSARQLGHPGCEGAVRGALAESGLPPESLALDVTETAFIDALQGNGAALERVQALGVRISIDDFGMGYSSLSYLKRLPADTLKIDRSFLRGFGEDARDTALVRMVIDVGHTLGMEVVAEGVEGWAQAALLAETGCDMAQGYHFSGPVPPDDVPALLEEG